MGACPGYRRAKGALILLILALMLRNVAGAASADAMPHDLGAPQPETIERAAAHAGHGHDGDDACIAGADETDRCATDGAPCPTCTGATHISIVDRPILLSQYSADVQKSRKRSYHTGLWRPPRRNELL